MTNVLVILGPTGVGKTELSLALAEQYTCPILSADSRQIYRDLPIGTAAPTQQEQQRIKHYFVGTHTLSQTYNAGQYERDAHHLLSSLTPSGKVLALVTGGSTLYIDALCNGLDDIPSVSEATQRYCRDTYREKGLPWLQQQVQTLDPDYWNQVDQQNPQRLMHCLEVSLTTGQPYSEFRKGKNRTDTPYRFIRIGLQREREELYDRINRRVLTMMEQGLLDEAIAAFKAMNLSPNTPLPNSLNTVGYKELWLYYTGEWTLDKAVEMIQQNSRHYAKRQLTWWRRDPSITWLNAADDMAHNKQAINSLIQ